MTLFILQHVGFLQSIESSAREYIGADKSATLAATVVCYDLSPYKQLLVNKNSRGDFHRRKLKFVSLCRIL